MNLLHHSSRRQTVLIGILLLSHFLGGGAGAEDRGVDSLASPEEIVDQLTQWQERITTLRIVWEETIHDLDGQLRQKPVLYNRQASEWVWCRDGRSRFRTVTFLNDQFHENELQTDDGELAYQATYAAEDAPQTMPLTLTLTSSRTKGSPSPHFFIPHSATPLEGILFSSDGTWLGKRLETDRVETWGYESVGDRVLPFVSFEDGWYPILVLDPEAGYLPRIVRTGATYITTEYRVERFEEIEPGFWFPMSGTERTRSYEYPELDQIRHWRVKEVEINPSVAQSDLQIRPWKGTLVKDHLMGHEFTFGSGMPPDTMPNGLNRKMMDWLASGARGPHPFKPQMAVKSDSRLRALVLLVSLVICFVVFVGSLYWRRHAAEP